MSNNVIPSVANPPIELIYRIFDRLDILTSVRGVCSQWDEMTNTIITR
jgi:hypothetical protein